MDLQNSPNQETKSPTTRHIILNLAELYTQLHREAAVSSKPPPTLEVPAVSTRAEIAHIIAQALENDTTPVRLATEEEQIQRRQMA